jgi:hypothetical protein
VTGHGLQPMRCIDQFLKMLIQKAAMAVKGDAWQLVE